MDLRNYIVEPKDERRTHRASTGLISLIARVYAAGGLTTAEAADLHRRHAPGGDGLPECEHGIRCAAMVDGVPTCALCRVERRAAAA